jgi:hypothetical protein
LHVHADNIGEKLDEHVRRMATHDDVVEMIGHGRPLCSQANAVATTACKPARLKHVGRQDHDRQVLGKVVEPVSVSDVACTTCVYQRGERSGADFRGFISLPRKFAT